MKLNTQGVSARAEWERQGFKLPEFDIKAVRENTHANPAWLHFGAGNIFRAFPAAAQQELLNMAETKTGIIVCETFDGEIIEKSFAPYDNLCIVSTLKTDSIDNEVIASVTESMTIDVPRLKEIFISPSLQFVSFTITEKGYAVTNAAGELLPHIQADMSGPENAGSLMGIVAGLCLERFNAGASPISLVSMDNCAENGDKLKNAIMTLARAWQERGLTPMGFCEYLDSKMAFPVTMIDKITPRPSEIVADRLKALGCEDMDIVRTSKNTYVAPFVNAEETQYLVIEDKFPNGRPPLEKAGLIFTDRTTVDNVEKMKVGACLNPLHSVLAVFGCLLGYSYIHETMQNKSLVNLIRQVGYKEAMPHVPDPGIIKPADFIKQVIEVRLPNPYIPDTPQRIASDTSQKIPVRFGGTLRKITEAGGELSELEGFPFFFAGWLRYLMGVDDTGSEFEPSPDPMLDELRAVLDGIKLGDQAGFSGKLRPILSNAAIFGVDLYDGPLAAKTEELFARFISGPGAVAEALEELY